MKNYSVHKQGSCSWGISGENIISAIELNFKKIAHAARIGNVAGYRLVDVRATYNPGILGGKGGCELLITATEKNLRTPKTLGLRE